MNAELVKRLESLGFDIVGEKDGIPVVEVAGGNSDSTVVYVKKNDGTTEKVALRAAQLLAKK